jgi:hypothetical protein
MRDVACLLKTTILCLAFSLLPALANADDRAGTSGLAVGTGVGNENAFLGVHLAYYLQLPNDRWRVAPLVGIGVFPGISSAGYAGGLMALFGKRHRMVMELLAAPYAAEGGTWTKDRYWYGVGLLAGYEWMTWYGLVVRSAVGIAYRPELSDQPINLAINVISLDYKIW